MLAIRVALYQKELKSTYPTIQDLPAKRKIGYWFTKKHLKKKL